MSKTLLITGGCGYIGSHCVVELLEKGYSVIIIDNFLNSSEEALNRIKEITKKEIKFYKVDINNRVDLQVVFEENNDIHAVIHFAGLKSVGESCSKPLYYYSNNVNGSLVLFQLMQEYNVKNIIFSSSATVYGENAISPIKETSRLEATNPYGQTKIMIEHILNDLCKSDPEFTAVTLRYFNPIGAHPSGLLGEDPNGIPNNLLPYVSQVCSGRREKLFIFGDDYDTIDGTGVRDYIHVVDLAHGHIAALQLFDEEKEISVDDVNRNFFSYNLGTGCGHSVLEVVKVMETVSHKTIPYDVVERRNGDVAINFADPSKALKELSWKANRSDLLTMCTDLWNFQLKNPYGYNNNNDSNNNNEESQ